MGIIFSASAWSETDYSGSAQQIHDAVIQYYDNEGVWAGKYKIVSISKIRVQETESGLIAHVKYKYSALSGRNSGYDQRQFFLQQSGNTFSVSRMGEQNSAYMEGKNILANSKICTDYKTSQDRFEIQEKGDVVLDKSTGYLWTRCPLGQKWGDGKCLGIPLRLEKRFVERNLIELKLGKMTNWSLPDINVFATLSDKCGNLSQAHETFGLNEPTIHWVSNTMGNCYQCGAGYNFDKHKYEQSLPIDTPLLVRGYKVK